MRAQNCLLHFPHIECKLQRGRQAGSLYSSSPGLGEYHEAFSKSTDQNKDEQKRNQMLDLEIKT